MRYYVASDIHGYFSEFHHALAKAGYFNDTEPHKLILLGDLFDRGREAKKMEAFVMDLLDKDEIILIRGNHEDLFEELVTDDHGTPYKHHMSNGTFDTAMQLTHFDLETAVFEPDAFVEAAKQTPFFRRILPEMRLYYETAQHIFVHGWIPCIREKSGYSYRADWRNATGMEWRKARWYNGIDAAVTSQEEKTVVCGHWHTSYGHSKYLNKGTEFGLDACFEPYHNTGIIAIDGCTAYSGIVNVVVIEDSEIEGVITMSEIRRSPFEDGVNPTTSLEGDMLQTMKECSRIAAENGISDMSLEEINEEIGKARAQIRTRSSKA